MHGLLVPVLWPLMFCRAGMDDATCKMVSAYKNIVYVRALTTPLITSTPLTHLSQGPEWACRLCPILCLKINTDQSALPIQYASQLTAATSSVTVRHCGLKRIVWLVLDARCLAILRRSGATWIYCVRLIQLHVLLCLISSHTLGTWSVVRCLSPRTSKRSLQSSGKAISARVMHPEGVAGCAIVISINAT